MEAGGGSVLLERKEVRFRQELTKKEQREKEMRGRVRGRGERQGQ